MRDYKQIIEKILANSNSKVTVRDRDSNNERDYIVQKSEATLTIAISDSWLGYELDIHKSVLGRQIGRAEDTDNYPLDGEYEDVTEKVFDEIINCLNAFLHHDIYIGKIGKKIGLALPKLDKFLLVQGGRFVMEKRLISKAELTELGFRSIK